PDAEAKRLIPLHEKQLRGYKQSITAAVSRQFDIIHSYRCLGYVIDLSYQPSLSTTHLSKFVNMPIDFHLGPTEAATRAAAAAFAQNVLKPARAEYLKHEEHPKRFQATKPAYAAAVQGGLLKGQISPALGGNAGSLIEAAILVEE